MSEDKFKLLLDAVEDKCSDLFFYDRKEDEELTLSDVEDGLTEDQKRRFIEAIKKLI